MKKSNYLPVKWLTPEEFNKKVELNKLLHRKVKIESSITRVNMTVQAGKYTTRYSVDLIKGAKPIQTNLASIAAMFKKLVPVITEGYGRREIPAPTFEVPGHTKIVWDYLDPGNFSYINCRYKLKNLICYSYDINSAYSRAMLQPMPDTSQPRFDSIVGPGEIGFRKNSILVPVVGEGRHADVVFKLVESPYKEYVYKYYKLKQNEAQDSEKRAYYKFILNIASGLLHRYNIFHRLMVLHYAKTYIQEFIDEDTVYCNVDSIISKRKRDDLPISNDIGDFKLEHNGDKFKFKQIGIYQWNDEVHYSGIPSKAINDIEDVKNINQFTEYYYEGGQIWPIRREKRKQEDSSTM